MNANIPKVEKPFGMFGFVCASPNIIREAGIQRVDFALCSRSGFTGQLTELSGQRSDVFLFNWEQMAVPD